MHIYFSAAFAVIFIYLEKEEWFFSEKASQCNTAIAVSPIKAINRLSQLQKHVGPKSIMISMCGRQTEIAPVLAKPGHCFNPTCWIYINCSDNVLRFVCTLLQAFLDSCSLLWWGDEGCWLQSFVQDEVFRSWRPEAVIANFQTSNIHLF